MKKQITTIGTAKIVIRITAGKVQGTVLDEYTRIFLITKEVWDKPDQAKINLIYSQATAYETALWKDNYRIHWVKSEWILANPQ